MFKYTATVFNSLGLTSSQKGETPEEAMQKATDCHSSFRGKTITYRAEDYNGVDGVIFADGVACGVVYKHAPLHNHQTFGG